MWIKFLSFIIITLHGFLLTAQPTCDDALGVLKTFSQRSNRPTISKFGSDLKLEFAPPQVSEVNLEFIISQLKLRKPKGTKILPAVKYMNIDPLGEFIVLKFAEEWQPSFLPYANQIYAVLKKVITNTKTGDYKYELFSRFYLPPQFLIKRLIFAERSTKLILHLTTLADLGAKSSLSVIELQPGWSQSTQQMQFEMDRLVEQVLFFAHPQDPTQFLLALIKPDPESEDINHKLVRFVSYSSLSGRILPIGKLAKLPKSIHQALSVADSDSSTARAFFISNLSNNTFVIRSAFFILEQNSDGLLNFFQTNHSIKRTISIHQPWLSHEYHKTWNVLSVYNQLGPNGFISLGADPIEYSLLHDLPWGGLIATPGNGFLFQEMSSERSGWLWFAPYKSSPVYLEGLHGLHQVVVLPNLIAGIKADHLGYPRLVFIDIIPQLIEVAH